MDKYTTNKSRAKTAYSRKGPIEWIEQSPIGQKTKAIEAWHQRLLDDKKDKDLFKKANIAHKRAEEQRLLMEYCEDRIAMFQAEEDYKERIHTGNDTEEKRIISEFYSERGSVSAQNWLHRHLCEDDKEYYNNLYIESQKREQEEIEILTEKIIARKLARSKDEVPSEMMVRVSREEAITKAGTNAAHSIYGYDPTGAKRQAAHRKGIAKKRLTSQELREIAEEKQRLHAEAMKMVHSEESVEKGYSYRKVPKDKVAGYSGRGKLIMVDTLADGQVYSKTKSIQTNKAFLKGRRDRNARDKYSMYIHEHGEGSAVLRRDSNDELKLYTKPNKTK